MLKLSHRWGVNLSVQIHKRVLKKIPKKVIQNSVFHYEIYSTLLNSAKKTVPKKSARYVESLVAKIE